MELRSVKENEVRKYPKINEVGIKKLKKFIPSKWTKVGVSSLVMGLFLSRKMTKAVTEVNPEVELQGAATIQEPPIIEIISRHGLCLSAIGIICCVINIIWIKVGNRKKDEGDKKKVSNVVKTFLIIFIVIAIVCGGILVLRNIDI